MSETLSLESFLEKATGNASKSIVEKITPKIFEFVPEETVTNVNAILKGFAEDPERYASALERILHAKRTAAVQSSNPMQTPHFTTKENLQRNNTPTQPQNKNANEGEVSDVQTDQTASLTDDEKFEQIYAGIIEEFKEMEPVAGHLTVSQLIEYLEKEADTVKPQIRPYFDLIRSY